MVGECNKSDGPEYRGTFPRLAPGELQHDGIIRRGGPRSVGRRQALCCNHAAGSFAQFRFVARGRGQDVH